MSRVHAAHVEPAGNPEPATGRADVLLRALLEAASNIHAAATIAIDPHGDVLYANARFACLWSLPAPQFSRSDANIWPAVMKMLVDPLGFLRIVTAPPSAPGAVDVHLLHLKDRRRIECRSIDVTGSNNLLLARLWQFSELT